MAEQQAEVIAVIEASPARRVMGVGMLATVAGIAGYVVVTTPPSLGWGLFLGGVALGCGWLAHRLWQATAHRIELTEEVLRCSDGREIAKISELEHIDRGFFAFKPSNGFLLRSTQDGGRSWYPGLWWRMGRRIGIGGVTPGAQAKAMSEMIAALIALGPKGAAG